MPAASPEPARPGRGSTPGTRHAREPEISGGRLEPLLRVGSLFSGIGGLDTGLARAEWEHAFLCESDEWRRDVLRARFPGVPVYDDVRDVATLGSVEDVGEGRDDHGALGSARRGERPLLPVGNEVPAIDLLCGGFPCQDVSVAGQRRGLAGARSGLFHEFARIAGTLRPRWLLVENVPGLLSSNGGRDFGVVLGTLADLGYGLGWRVLDSRFFGVPQRRRRVFVVGALIVDDPRAAAERAGQVLAVGSRCARHPATRGEAGPDVAVASLSGLGNGCPDDNDAQAGRVIAVSSVTGDEYAGALPTLDKGAEDGPRRNQDAPIIVSSTLKSQRGKAGGGIGPEETLIAAPLSHESNPNSNAAGRRREDDFNLVTGFSHTQGIDAQPSADAWPTLRSEGGGHAVGIGASVRRLTPTECSRLQALPDGWLELESEYGRSDTPEAHAAQVLRRLWLEAGTEAGEGWGSRVALALLTPEVLLAGVHGGWISWEMAARRAAERRALPGADAWPEGFVRGLRLNAERRSSPYGREPFEQLAGELGRSLPELPLEEAQARAALLGSRLWAEASQAWPVRHALPAGEERDADGQARSAPARSSVASPDSRRYAGLGDAVTATVGYWLGNRFRIVDEL